MKAIILAGGSGTRLWPLSRRNFPKQFLNVTGDSSLLRQTAQRLLKAVSPDDIVVMTNDTYRFYVKKDMDGLAGGRQSAFTNIILEPAARNTAPAIALGIAYCRDRLGSPEDEVLFVCRPTISSVRLTVSPLMSERGSDRPKGLLLIFGVNPDKPKPAMVISKKAGHKSSRRGIFRRRRIR
jgi:mannose-1-phosphate guanylyltransferase/mannose-6-phosphate isomerase